MACKYIAIFLALINQLTTEESGGAPGTWYLTSDKREGRNKMANESKYAEADRYKTILEMEIIDLKFELTDREETIDELCRERDRKSKEIYKMKLMLADAWNLQLATDAEKVKEVGELIKQGGSKLYSDAEENINPDMHIIEPKESLENLKKTTTAITADSGIDLRSLEEFIDERIATTLEKKSCEELTNIQIAEKVSDEKVINVYASKTEMKEPEPQWTTTDQRDRNIIIHELTEDEGEMCSNTVNEIFKTVEFDNESTASAIRLGSKTSEKSRPIRITLSSYRKKKEFMSTLWKLKLGPQKFHKISVTDDYTKDEREEIKRWVTEAKKRTERGKGFVWKVRGSPRTQLRLTRFLTHA